MEPLIKRIEEDREKMIQQVKVLKDGGGRLRTNNGIGWVDITPDWINELERRIAEDDRLLAKIAERC